jgi:hypothetical protein
MLCGRGGASSVVIRRGTLGGTPVRSALSTPALPTRIRRVAISTKHSTPCYLGLMADVARERVGLAHGQFLNLKHWKEAQRIVMGGGFSGTRVGQLAIGRAAALLKAQQITIEISIIHNNPIEAGLIGAVHIVPTPSYGGTASRSRAEKKQWMNSSVCSNGSSPRERGRSQPCAIHRRRLSRTHRRGWLDRGWRSESSRQLEEQSV